MKLFSRSLGVLSNTKRQKFQFQVVIHGAFNVLPKTGSLYVTWKNGHRLAMTKAAVVNRGEARWGETLRLVVTLHMDSRTQKVDDKTSLFMLRETLSDKKDRLYGEVSVNLATFANHSKDITQEVKMPLKNGSRTLLTHFHFSVKAKMLDGASPTDKEDVASEINSENFSDIDFHNSDGGDSASSAENYQKGKKQMEHPTLLVDPLAPEDPLAYLLDLDNEESFRAFMEQPEPQISADPNDLTTEPNSPADQVDSLRKKGSGVKKSDTSPIVSQSLPKEKTYNSLPTHVLGTPFGAHESEEKVAGHTCIKSPRTRAASANAIGLQSIASPARNRVEVEVDASRRQSSPMLLGPPALSLEEEIAALREENQMLGQRARKAEEAAEHAKMELVKLLKAEVSGLRRGEEEWMRTAAQTDMRSKGEHSGIPEGTSVGNNDVNLRAWPSREVLRGDDNFTKSVSILRGSTEVHGEDNEESDWKQVAFMTSRTLEQAVSNLQNDSEVNEYDDLGAVKANLQFQLDLAADSNPLSRPSAPPHPVCYVAAEEEEEGGGEGKLSAHDSTGPPRSPFSERITLPSERGDDEEDFPEDEEYLGLSVRVGQLEERVAYLENVNKNLLEQLDVAQSRSEEVGELEAQLITARVKLAEADYQHGVGRMTEKALRADLSRAKAKLVLLSKELARYEVMVHQR